MYQQLSTSAVSSKEVPDIMAYCQGDVPRCASEPDVPGTSLDEGIPALASLKDGHLRGIFKEEVDQLPSEVRGPDLDCHQGS